MAAEIYPGPFAKEAQITTQMLLDSTPLPGLETVKKGLLILELHKALKSNLITWATFSQWYRCYLNQKNLNNGLYENQSLLYPHVAIKCKKTTVANQSLTSF